ncbi:hypothetical protein HUU42_13090, partial [bacterium]|nr:hypothetical protein [bacterium]
QREVELQLGWLRGQLINPVDYVPLPEALDESDLRAVAIHLLQTADEESIHAAVNFSIASCKGLAGIEAIVSRATYFAKLAGRSAVARNDIRAAIKAVIPAENALRTALGDNPLDVRVSTGGAPPAESGSTAAAHGDERPGSNRILQPTPPETSNRERGENAGIVSAIA